MSHDHHPPEPGGIGREPLPPRALRRVARLLIRGRDARYILADLDTSFARDVERRLGRGRAVRRYAWNTMASAGSVWATGLRGILVHGVGLDAKLGLRMLSKQPLITAVAGLALGIGIPASLTLVHAVDVVFSHLPVPDGDRVVGIRHYDVALRHPPLSTIHDYEQWREDLTSFESVGAVRSYSVNVNADVAGGAAPVRAAEITASGLAVLRARPILGRLLDTADQLDGAPDVVLLGEDLWSARFGRDPRIVGRTVMIGRMPHTVVGVMPADFRFPSSDQAWLPLRGRAVDFGPAGGPQVRVFGRLESGVSIADARVEMQGFTARRANDDPERFERLVGDVVNMPLLLLDADPGRDSVWGDQELLILQLLIFGLLVVLCGNVGTLILARTATRSAEVTIRTALGASRGRILTQLFVEALVLSLAATGSGLLLVNAFAGWLMDLPAVSEALPWWVDLRLTPRTIAIAFGVAALSAVLAGVVPALSATRQAIQANLQRAAARGASVRFGLGSSALIVGEIVLSMGFVALGATAVRSQLLSQRADLGFDPERYVVGSLTVPELDPADAPGPTDSIAWTARLRESQRALLERLAEDPSVAGVGMGLSAPTVVSANRHVILETPLVDFEPDLDILVRRVDVSFFSGLNRPVLAGRDFNSGDVEAPRTAVIVNESFVADVLGGRNAIGQRFRYVSRGFWWDVPDEEFEIVGVVGAFGINPHDPTRGAAVYHALPPGEWNPNRYTVEVAGDAEAFLPGFRRAAAAVDPEATVEASVIAATLRADSQVRRLSFLLMLAIAAATFLLSSAGIYALLSFTVSQRKREIGIRTALGAGAADIASTVARRAAFQVGVGLVLGVGWSWVVLENQPFSIQLGNVPITLALTAAVAAVVCTLACVSPTLRGLRIEPTEALREV